MKALSTYCYGHQWSSMHCYNGQTLSTFGGFFFAMSHFLFFFLIKWLTCLTLQRHWFLWYCEEFRKCLICLALEDTTFGKRLAHRVGAQGHSPPTASTELCLTIGTQVPAAICKLGLMTNSTGGCVVSMDRARRRRGLPDYRFPVAR